MKITYDPAKRDKTLEDRGLDFVDATQFFTGRVREIEDTRCDYGERRMISYGTLNNRRIVVCYVQRGDVRHIISMRNCHEKEWDKIWF